MKTSKTYRASLIALTLFAFAAISLLAQDRDDWQRHNNGGNASQTIRANISGGSGNGKCTFEVMVYGVAEVQIRGDEGRLVSLDGSPVEWRRLNCNQALPYSANDFHFSGVDGHGRQNLAQSPSGNNGVAVIRIDNTVGNRAGKPEGYTGEFSWKGGRYGNNTRHGNDDWRNGANSWMGGSSASIASQACMNVVVPRIQQEHQNVANLRAMPETTTESEQSDGRIVVQGEGQYQVGNGNYGKFNYRCLYDPSRQQVIESSYGRE
jgi:hypothetical protein